jgi:hypothetical protein
MRALRTGLLAATLLAGCVVKPAQLTRYDADCQVHRRLVLARTEPHHALQRTCERQPFNCPLALVAAGIVTAGTTVMTGTVVVAGNVMSWVEQAQGCPAPEKAREDGNTSRPPQDQAAGEESAGP